MYCVVKQEHILMRSKMMRAQKGFTLVEILIVVVILGILAAIVIPQFTDASVEAKTARIRTDLQTMRSQIELYKIQNNDTAPATLQILADEGYMNAVPIEAFGGSWIYDTNTVTSDTTDPVLCTGF